jgi:hypothetical protein
MTTRVPWLLGQAIWASGMMAWALYSLGHRPRIGTAVTAVYFLSLAMISLAAWSGRIRATRLVPMQLAGLVAISSLWVAVQLWEYISGTLYADSPATMIVAGITVCFTLLPSALFLAISLRTRHHVQQPAA